MPKYKFVKRLLRNRFYNLLLWLIERIPNRINKYTMVKKNLPQWEYVRAFVVLFSKNERYFIPQKKCLEYGQLLGISIKGIGGVTTSSLRKHCNFNQLRTDIYREISKELSGSADASALLDFFYVAETPYQPFKYEAEKYTVVGMNSTATSLNPIYTPGQSHCVVVIFCINGRSLVLSHYSRKKINEMMEDLRRSVTLIPDEITKLDCYILSDRLIEDAALVQDMLHSILSIEIKYYGHYKPPEKSNHMTYNIKVAQDDGLVDISNTALPLATHASNSFYRMYAERGRELVPIENFRSTNFNTIAQEDFV